jgi:hypothetical protein
MPSPTGLIREKAQRLWRAAAVTDLPPTAADWLAEWRITIRQAASMVDDSDKQLRATVAAARAAGVSWRGIGDALGVSRQAAQERFREVK